MGELLLGIDIGTNGSKGCLARPDGAIVAVAERPHRVSHPYPGWSEHDAETTWWGDVVSICRELIAAADDAVAAIAISGIGPALLPADADGGPLRPAILYGIDTRAMAEAAELTQRWALEDPLGADSVAPKIAWLARHEPDVHARMRRVFMPQSLAAWRLTSGSAYVIDHPSAIDSLYDPARRCWLPERASEVAPDLVLPDLVWPPDQVGTVSAEAAAETGLPEGCIVACGTRDSFADGVSVGLTDPGDALLIYGSTMSFMEVTSDVGGPYVSPDVRFVGTAMASSGALTTWFQALVGEDVSFARLTEEATAIRPGADGLLVLPYFSGERSPLADPDARGVICGLTVHRTRAHLYRALLEAVAFGQRHCLDSLAECECPKSSAWGCAR